MEHILIPKTALFFGYTEAMSDTTEQNWAPFDGGLQQLKKIGHLAIRAQRLQMLQHLETLQSMVHIHAADIREAPGGDKHLTELLQRIDDIRSTL